jgi:hypothetical protein
MGYHATELLLQRIAATRRQPFADRYAYHLDRAGIRQPAAGMK